MPVDGAVAIILMNSERATSLPHTPVYINSFGHATGRDPSWDEWTDLSVNVSRFAARELWARTDLKPADVDVADVYDGFSYLALCWLEDLGFCQRGGRGTL